MIARWLGAGLAVALLCAPAAAREFKSGGITVVTPWARATPGGAKVGGAYVEIKAAPGADDRLVSARSPVARVVEIHEHAHEGSIMKMRRVDGVTIAGGKTVTFKPGGYHFMLMDLQQPLKHGGKMPLTLVFEKAGEINVEATIAPIGAMGPDAGASGASTKAPAGHKH